MSELDEEERAHARALVREARDALDQALWRPGPPAGSSEWWQHVMKAAERITRATELFKRRGALLASCMSDNRVEVRLEDDPDETGIVLELIGETRTVRAVFDSNPKFLRRFFRDGHAKLGG